jgi:hypothetical protein
MYARDQGLAIDGKDMTFRQWKIEPTSDLRRRTPEVGTSDRQLQESIRKVDKM